MQSDWNETDATSDAFIKNKPTIPDAYDDTALSNRVKTIEDDYAKSSDIPSLSGYATETWVNEQGFLTQHQDLTDYAKKTDIPTTLPNPHALTFTGAVTGTYDGSEPLRVQIPSAVTDDHINELINTALNGIGIAEEGVY